MDFSVSELKTFRTCPRKWMFSGRNGLYLRPTTDKDAFLVGTAFHGVMEEIYEGNLNFSLDKIIEDSRLKNEDDIEILKFQVDKYIKNVYEKDMEFMEDIKTELSYRITLEEGIYLFGFIDAVYKNKYTGKTGILEHKFSKNFRSDTYNILDEQLKAYDLACIINFGECDEGVNVNQVRKLKTKFSHSRDKVVINEKQRALFLDGIIKDAKKMGSYRKERNFEVEARSDWMGCGFCEYRNLCTKMEIEGTNDVRVLSLEDIAKEGLVQKNR